MNICTCLICGATVESEQAAVYAGWLAGFWADEHTDVSEPVCPACSTHYMTGHDAEPILRPEFRSLPVIGNWQR